MGSAERKNNRQIPSGRGVWRASRPSTRARAPRIRERNGRQIPRGRGVWAAMKKLSLAGVLAFTVSCGAPADTEQQDSELQSRARITCQAGDDLDGDGIVDRFSNIRPRFFSAASPAACRAANGTPFELWANSSSTRGLAAAQTPSTAAATQSYPAGGTPPVGLRQDVINTGIHKKEYVDGLYDCDDFANDLEDALEDLGYHATYTEICIPGSPASYHAITDIHLDGQTYWFDAITGVPYQLDAGGDGQVQTSTSGSPCAVATEGRMGVRVWESFADRLTDLGPAD